MRTSTRERRDWTLLIFIIPIGIILMLIAGQIAVRLVPIWSINAGMQSNLDPNNLSQQQQNGIVQPVLPAILTPLGWLDTFLTPGADSGNQNVVFPPFVVFEPTATPAITLPPPTVATTPPPPTSVTVSPTMVVIPPTTGTQKPPEGGTSATTAVPTATTAVPTATTAVPTATTAVPTGFPSTPFGTQVMSTPAGLNIGAPNGTISGLSDNNYYVIDLGSSQSNQIYVTGSSETNYYDMV